MNDQKAIIELIKSISGQAMILTIPRLFITLTDNDINTALLLSQCIYWSSKTKNSQGWFYKSYPEWQDETGMSPYQVSRAAQKLKEMTILETKISLANGAPTLHYKIEFASLRNLIIKKLDNPLSRNLMMDHQETSWSLTEITIDYNKDYTPKGVLPKTEEHTTCPPRTDLEERVERKKASPQQEVVGVLSEVTGLDYRIKTNAGRLAKRGKELLAAGYFPFQVLSLYGSGGWWYKEDWRGRKGQRPTPEDVLSTIATALEESRPAEPRIVKIDFGDGAVEEREIQ